MDVEQAASVRATKDEPGTTAGIPVTAESAYGTAITAFAQWCHGSRGGADLPDTGTGNAEVDNAARASGKLGDRPLIVLTAGRSGVVESDSTSAFPAVWVHQLQADLARLSTHGRQIIIGNSAHMIQFEAPEAVVDAVREVVTDLRRRR